MKVYVDRFSECWAYYMNLIWLVYFIGIELWQVSLKHSGSLFMYAGNEGGAYAKNSFGNMYVLTILDSPFSQAIIYIVEYVYLVEISS